MIRTYSYIVAIVVALVTAQAQKLIRKRNLYHVDDKNDLQPAGEAMRGFWQVAELAQGRRELSEGGDSDHPDDSVDSGKGSKKSGKGKGKGGDSDHPDDSIDSRKGSKKSGKGKGGDYSGKSKGKGGDSDYPDDSVDSGKGDKNSGKGKGGDSSGKGKGKGGDSDDSGGKGDKKGSKKSGKGKGGGKGDKKSKKNRVVDSGDLFDMIMESRDMSMSYVF
jgi:hypothetical protein